MDMNMKVLIGVVVLVLLAAGAYMLWGIGAPGGYGPKTNVVVGGGSTSIEQLVEAGSPVVCTFATSTSSGSESGTIYIANGMAAGDFTVNDAAAGSSLKAHMILKGAKSYAWTSASSQGFTSSVGTSTSSNQNQSLGYTAQMNYACQAWVVDSGKFIVPGTISFN